MLMKKILILLSTLFMTIFYINTYADDTIYTADKLNIIATSQSPEFTIKLKSNPSTGYVWFLRDYNNNLLTPVKHVYQKPGQEMPGAPGFELWTFRVKPSALTIPQQTVIRFIYARPWEGVNGSTQIEFRVSTMSLQN